MDLKISIIFTATFRILVYHGEAAVVSVLISVLIFLFRHEDSADPDETFTIMFLDYLSSLAWTLKYMCMWHLLSLVNLQRLDNDECWPTNSLLLFHVFPQIFCPPCTSFIIRNQSSTHEEIGL